MDRPRTEVPQTRIYFTTHRSGAFPVPGLRTVVRGERASRSIVNRTTAAPFIGVVESLILVGLVLVPVFVYKRGVAKLGSRAEHTEQVTQCGSRPAG